ncbi:hypothetical protein AeRB84_003070 [Aphanomyces euteiches]|nr:hypothetical protein AeRB84_003070 [Aphanomyces euteiches]
MARWVVAMAILCAWASQVECAVKIPDNAPRMRHIPAMLASQVEVSQRTLSDHTPPFSVPASRPIDLFGDENDNSACEAEGTCFARNSEAYSGVLYHVEPCTDGAAESALAAAIATLKLPPRKDIQLLESKVLQLDVTQDGIHQFTVMGFNYIKERYGFAFPVNHGMNFYLTFALGDNIHRVVVHLNTLEHEYSILEHTYRSAKEVSQEAVGRPVKIATYNVWNVNPPNGIYDDRWAVYNTRMDHLAKFLNEINADIVGLQELRIDDTFGPVGDHAQIQHLVHRLDENYQFVYRAAMSYVNKYVPLERIEEGPAIVSKHPILSSDYVLLSRQLHDPNDVHQRLCLHAAIQVPGYGVVDVYVTHLSLSERSREQTMVEIWEFMQQGKGDMQVLLGDLNAEPQTKGIQFLQGKASLQNVQTDLHDAWLELHPEPTPASGDPHDIANAFTFPSDAPIKRIDYVLYRGQGRVTECSIFGQDPTEDTADFPKDKGMLSADRDSTVYASDHRGVVATFSL